MKAVVITTPGGPEVLKIQEVEDPKMKDDEVLIRVAATALNRADTLQRQGKYPPPKGDSEYPGLECSGTVEAVGKNVHKWKVGDQVCALVGGGGYAEKVAVPAGQVLPVPSGVSLEDAASFPEVACTVWSTVFMMSRLSPGETFLIHGGSSGIGTFAIQMAKHQGVKVFVTAGSEEKLAACKELGADVCINYKTEDFVARVKQETGGKGVDVILDNIGGPYLQRNIDSLNFDGRLFIIGFMGGTVTEVNLVGLLARRLTVQAAGLRNRSAENKAAIVSEVEKNVWPAIAAGKVKAVVYKRFALAEAAEAHRAGARNFETQILRFFHSSQKNHLPLIMSSSGINDGEKMVRLRANDGEEFEVAESVAALSQTVKFVVEDAGLGEECVIPLLKVDGKTLAKILEYCKVHAADGKSNAEKKEFDKKFVEVDQAEVYDLLTAANYLEIRELLDIMIQRVVDMIKGKTAEEIRKIFKIKNDFTPEEEEQMKRDNAWAF
nr:quinone oxidoreductase PIG3 [Ipomoea batatas]